MPRQLSAGMLLKWRKSHKREACVVGETGNGFVAVGLSTGTVWPMQRCVPQTMRELREAKLYLTEARQ